ncbi:MAG TPA: FxsA family protein [Acidimicrobiales bacterium]|nr:FxsA family protein [Acidimicrobiales bacterium]
MGFGVLVAFVLLVFGEIWVALQVAHHIGVLATLGLILLISASGPWLVRRQGVGLWRRASRRLNDGEVPGREAVDGLLLLIAGVLLTVPGFITGVFGALLLLGPIRKLVRTISGAWLTRRALVGDISVRTYRDGWLRGRADDPVINADTHDVVRERHSPVGQLDPPVDR